jgi:hypothetical protein
MLTNLIIRICSFVFLCIFCSISFGMEAPAATSPIEEGWRYGGSLKVIISKTSPGTDDSRVGCGAGAGSGTTIDPLDVEPIHHPMAYMVDEAPGVQAGGSDGRYYCCFRFTQVIKDVDHGTRLGKTVAVTSDMVDERLQVMKSPGYEYIFASGFSKYPSKSHFRPFFSSCDAKYDSLWEDAFVVSRPTKPTLPYNFLTRHYMTPERLKRNVSFRYGSTLDASESSLKSGPIGKIKEIHCIDVDGKVGANLTKLGQVKKFLDETEGFLTTMDMPFLKPLKDALNPLKSVLGERTWEFEGLGDTKETNAYACAEQTGLDFIADERVFARIQSKLEVTDPKVLGILIHCHTTRSPCGTCATSLARECEEGGVLKELSKGKPLHLINTTSEIYERPSGQIQVKETTSFHHMVGTSLAEFNSPISFNLAAHSLPFTTILYKSVMGGTDYSVDINHIKTEQQKAHA